MLIVLRKSLENYYRLKLVNPYYITLQLELIIYEKFDFILCGSSSLFLIPQNESHTFIRSLSPGFLSSVIPDPCSLTSSSGSISYLCILALKVVLVCLFVSFSLFSTSCFVWLNQLLLFNFLHVNEHLFCEYVPHRTEVSFSFLPVFHYVRVRFFFFVKSQAIFSVLFSWS